MAMWDVAPSANAVKCKNYACKSHSINYLNIAESEEMVVISQDPLAKGMQNFEERLLMVMHKGGRQCSNVYLKT